MSMLALPPIAVDDTVMTSTTAVETVDVWDVETTYAQYERALKNKWIWESQVDDNTGNDPETDDAGNWIRVGPSNVWAAFYYDDTTPSVGNDLQYVLEPSESVDTILIYGVNAQAVTVTVEFGGETVFSETRELSTTASAIDFYDWFFGPQVVIGNTTFLDLPAYPIGATITIAFSGATSVSAILPSYAFVLGNPPVYGAELDTKYFGDFEPNDFGQYAKTENNLYRATASFEFYVEASSGVTTRRFLDSHKGRVMGWFGASRYEETQIVGFAERSPSNIGNPTFTRFNIDIVGILQNDQ